MKLTTNTVDMYHKVYYILIFIAPSEPQSLQVVSVNSSSVTFQWRPPEILNGTIRQYSIQFDETVINITGNMLMGTVDGLSPETVYTLRLRAYTGAGAGPPSSITVITCKLLNTITCYVYFVTVAYQCKNSALTDPYYLGIVARFFPS